MLLVSGCWDMREINELGLVMAVAVDKSTNYPNNYLVTVQLANPKGGGATGQQSSAPTGLWIAEAEGKTIFEAIRKIAQSSSHRIMWAHNNIIIIGESLAQDDITPVVNFFTHNYELRMKTLVAVGKGKAGDFLTATVGMGDVPGLSLSDLFRNQQFTGQGLTSTMLRIFEKFTSETTNPIMTALSFSKVITQPGVLDKAENTQKQIRVEGAAVFDETKLLGYLTPEETTGLSWILGDNPNTVISVVDPEIPVRATAIEVSNVKHDITSQFNEGTLIPKINIRITGVGKLSEDHFSNMSITAYKTRWEALLNEQIARQVEQAIAKVQKEYQSDVLGFGDIVHGQHKTEWHESIKNNWHNVFTEAEVNVEAYIDIQSSALYQLPFYNYKARGSAYDHD
jgi:spore germination protein KC